MLNVILYFSGINFLYRKFFLKKHLLLLGYHSISDIGNRGEMNYDVYKHLSVTKKNFEKQLTSLRREGYRFLNIKELGSAMEGTRDSKKFVAICFDDGFKDNFVNAYPVLKKLNIPANIFPAVDFIERKKLYWGSDLDPQKADIFLSWEELCAMKDVFEFGSHTTSHKKLKGLPEEEIKKEINKSKNSIETKTNTKVTALSLPHSQFDANTIKIVEDLGFSYVFSCGRGVNKFPIQKCLKKVPVSAKDSMIDFKVKIGILYPLIDFARNLFKGK